MILEYRANVHKQPKTYEQMKKKMDMFQSKVCTITLIIFPPNEREKTHKLLNDYTHIYNTQLLLTQYKNQKKKEENMYDDTSN